MWKKLWEKLMHPNVLLLTAAYIVTALFCGGAIVMAALSPRYPRLSALSYILYAFAALSLTYTVYTLVKKIPQWKRTVKERLHANPVTGELMRDFGLRTVVFSAGSFLWTAAYGCYHGGLSIYYRSVWYGSLAAYYIILACMRGAIVLYRRKQRGRARDERADLKRYRTVGCLLIVLILALSAAIVQMVATDAAFHSPGLLIYVSAAYTFTKITMSVRNFVRARKQSDYTVEALRSVNAADATVSLLTLQTAMFRSFGGDADTGAANAVTGACVCALVLALGVYMLVKARREEKRISEERNGRTE